MKNILVPIGSSKDSKFTLQYAIDFAQFMQAKVYVFKSFSVAPKIGTKMHVDSIVAREQVEDVKEVVDQIDTKGVSLEILSVKGGGVIDSIEEISKKINIDLIIVGQRPNDISEAYYLGRTPGNIVRQSDVPVLIIPEAYVYKPIAKILTAIKSGVISEKTNLLPLKEVLERFEAKMHLLQVKTQDFSAKDSVVNTELKAMTSSSNISENATLFQGVLEHLNSQNPDAICVIRRKRGFFKKLWEKNTINTIKKIDFESRVPLLVLKEAE